MTNQTIKKLNQLNLDFYKTVHTSFDQTRSNPWKGWDGISKYIVKLLEKKEKISVLDIGCGNGRFYNFLTSFLDGEKILFTGIDSDQGLLSLTEKKIKPTDTVLNIDIVKVLTTKTLSSVILSEVERSEIVTSKKEKNKLIKSINAETDFSTSFHSGRNDRIGYDLITLFGVLHHIPSAKLRTSLVTNIVNMLNNNGLAIIANWQFADDARYKKRFISPEEISANSDELEKNDYILDWQKGERALRYCHHTTDEEMENIVSRAKGKIIDSYFADGKSGKLNNYYVIGKM